MTGKKNWKKLQQIRHAKFLVATPENIQKLLFVLQIDHTMAQVIFFRRFASLKVTSRTLSLANVQSLFGLKGLM